MPKIIETPVYTYDELSEDAKETAREWYRSGALDYDWWESTYDDAEAIGLRITGFDCDRGTICGELYVSIGETCEKIVRNHGKHCGTYKLAEQYYRDRHNGNATTREDFEYALLQEYLSILQREVEYLLSNESVDESIRANEYTFTESGERFG